MIRIVWAVFVELNSGSNVFSWETFWAFVKRFCVCFFFWEVLALKIVCLREVVIFCYGSKNALKFVDFYVCFSRVCIYGRWRMWSVCCLLFELVVFFYHKNTCQVNHLLRDFLLLLVLTFGLLFRLFWYKSVILSSPRLPSVSFGVIAALAPASSESAWV